MSTENKFDNQKQLLAPFHYGPIPYHDDDDPIPQKPTRGMSMVQSTTHSDLNWDITNQRMERGSSPQPIRRQDDVIKSGRSLSVMHHSSNYGKYRSS